MNEKSPSIITGACKRCLFVDLPATEYHEALALQQEIVAARHAGTIEWDVILVLEHPPVFTIGRNGASSNLTVSQPFLKKRGIPFVRIERGGDITYHGPGQVVGYPILKLDGVRLTIKDYIWHLEEVMIRVAVDFGVRAERNRRNHGIWVKARKMGSTGIAVRRNITFHGFALNANIDLAPFDWIHPCGLSGVKMTSLENELHDPVDMSALRQRIQYHLESIFELDPVPVTLPQLRRLWSHEIGAETAVENKP